MMNLLLDIFAIRNISKGKAKNHTVDWTNVEQNTNVKEKQNISFS
jgi:hypothetical protein